MNIMNKMNIMKANAIKKKKKMLIYWYFDARMRAVHFTWNWWLIFGFLELLCLWVAISRFIDIFYSEDIGRKDR